MDIGEIEREIDVQPQIEPVPLREPAEAPERVEEEPLVPAV